MHRVQADDAEAFAELYDRHASRAFGVARALCFDAGRAEDAVQEGFLSIWRARRSYRPDKGSFQAWAMVAVRSRAVIERGDRDALVGALGQLPVTQAEVIALALFGELTHGEIAAQLALPPGTVKGRMRLGLEKLRSQLPTAIRGG
jgi:RNA polymerase sigma-70 factor (ECF subfamily)